MKTLAEVMDSNTDLTDFGFGTFRGQDFEEERRKLALSGAAFNATCGWISLRLRKAKRLNRKRSSYGMKHIAEKEIGYITNGVFIAAMIACGYSVKRIGPNACFDVAEASVSEAEQRSS